MDKIAIKGLNIRANHGVFASEKELGQNFIIDANVYLNFHPATINEDLTKSIHYGELSEFINSEFSKCSYDLIETAAYEVAIAVLNQYKLINEIELTINKPNAPIELKFDTVSVSVVLKRNLCYIAVGSNIGDSDFYIDNAKLAINKSKYTKVLNEAKRIKTKPFGNVNQDDFLNTVFEVETYLSPENLLKFINKIEKDNKRTREIHWGPRTLDLDIIYYNNEIVNRKDLFIPHLEMHKRDFVLKPLCELNPNMIHPRFLKTTEELLISLIQGK